MTPKEDMPTRITDSPLEVKNWIASQGGHPTITTTNGTTRLGVTFNNDHESRVEWDVFAKEIKNQELAFMYDDESNYYRFVPRLGLIDQQDNTPADAEGWENPDRVEAT